MTAPPRTVCVVTGSRAEYGLIEPIIGALGAASDFNVEIIATASHLSPEFGMTAGLIEADGYRITARVEMLVSSDTGVGIAKSLGLGVSGFADVFATIRPDLVLIPGDRFEMFAPALAGLFAGLPMAHLFGGDVTSGAYDDSVRHCLTKLCHMHLVTNEDAANRVRQLGEDPAAVHVVGNPGLDRLRTRLKISRPDLASTLGLSVDSKWILFTFHPVTRDNIPSADQLNEALCALEPFIDEGWSIIATQPNADNEGRALDQQLRAWASTRPNVAVFGTLGQTLYHAAIDHVEVVVGNSSSGLCEVPSFHKPTVNIGRRQDGRPRAGSVVDCPPERHRISASIRQAIALDLGDTRNPYGDGYAVDRIMKALRSVDNYKRLVCKEFHDIPLPTVF